MLDKLQKLALILERMEVLYFRAVEILDREKHSLIRVDFEGVLVAVAEKDEVLSAIRALDRDRLRIQDHFALVMDKSSAEVSLKFVAEQSVLAGGESAVLGTRLLALREQLGKTIAELRQKIVNNRDFVEQSVGSLRAIAENLNNTINGRRGAKPGPKTYTGKAKFETAEQPKGGLLEKRL